MVALPACLAVKSAGPLMVKMFTKGNPMGVFNARNGILQENGTRKLCK